jgi:hypothetical protein
MVSFDLQRMSMPGLNLSSETTLPHPSLARDVHTSLSIIGAQAALHTTLGGEGLQELTLQPQDESIPSL